VFQPAISGGAVFATGKDGEVTRIESGRTVWKTPLKTRVSGGVGSDGNLVAVGTPKGEVIALDAETGQVKWRVFINAEVLAAPAVSGGMVVVRSADSRLFGLDASDGKRRWTYQRATPALALQRGGWWEGNFIIAGYPGASWWPSMAPTAAWPGRAPLRCRAVRPSSSGWPTSPACR
jgi:outer membrane protein assembly factor BamB